MAHEIGEMFWVGEPPWHGLGRELARPASLDEALAAGGLDWDVALVPLRTADAGESRVATRRAVVRTDLPQCDERRVLGVVHHGFRPLQNREGAALFHRLFDLDEQRYHTGGYLRNGEVVWLLARLPDVIAVSDDDPVETYLLYSNSHDGSQAIDIRLTTVRVVCRNTLSLALQADSGRAFRRAHRASAQVLEQEAKALFQETRGRIEATQALFRLLASKPCDDGAFRRFVQALLPDPVPPAGMQQGSPRATAYDQRLATVTEHRAALERIRRDGLVTRGLAADPPTWWGAVNVVTGWVDHDQPIEGDRYAHTLFGSGDRIKRAALELAYARAAA
jgi:phage/plasmid-like protein (TIGR03299 family)